MARRIAAIRLVAAAAREISGVIFSPPRDAVNAFVGADACPTPPAKTVSTVNVDVVTETWSPVPTRARWSSCRSSARRMGGWVIPSTRAAASLTGEPYQKYDSSAAIRSFLAAHAHAGTAGEQCRWPIGSGWSHNSTQTWSASRALVFVRSSPMRQRWKRPINWPAVVTGRPWPMLRTGNSSAVREGPIRVPSQSARDAAESHSSFDVLDTAKELKVALLVLDGVIAQAM